MEPSEHTNDITGALRDDTQKLKSAATDRLQAEAEAQKGEATKQIKSLSSALGSAAQSVDSGASQWMKSALQEGAQALDRLSRSIEQKDGPQLLRSVEDVARNNPATFLAGCAALGFAAARVMRAGAAPERSPDNEKRPPSPTYEEQSGMNRPAVPLDRQDQGGATYQTSGSAR